MSDDEAVKLPDDVMLGEFKPCVIVNREVGLTTYVHEDVACFARPMTDKHFVDALIAFDDGRLVGVNFWHVPPPDCEAQEAPDVTPEWRSVAHQKPSAPSSTRPLTSGAKRDERWCC